MPRPPSPEERRRTLLTSERATERLTRAGRHRIALGFANSYEIGMSNLGFQWVYRLFNREDDVVCERFFHEEGELHTGRGPTTMETGTPLAAFPLVAFSISWEMDYVHFLRLLPAARIPLTREERGEGDPIVLVGGDCARINPAPLSPYVDAFAMGDGEKLVAPIAEILRRELPREATLNALASLPGLYVPSVHGLRAEDAEDGKVVVQQLKGAEGPQREPPHSTILTPDTQLSDRRPLNKKVSDEMLREKVRLIGAAGFTHLKLYLQVGLPGETDEDVEDLVRLVDDLRLIVLDEGRKRGRVPTLVPTVNCFIPKPHTPFETEELCDPESLKTKLARLDAAFRKMPNVTFRGMPVVEAIWDAYLAKMGLESVPILLEAAAGTPVRRIVKEHRETLMSVVRPGRADVVRGDFDPKLRKESPWGFVAKS